jgi:uncharacterized protein YdaU (DUF1376 family)
MPPDRPAPKEIAVHYYQFNIGDYRRDTTHLSLLEHGVYRQILDTYYLNGGPLEANHDKLMRTHSIRSADEVQAYENVIKDFFAVEGGLLIHKGCDKVIDAFRKKSESASASASARWKASDANALRTQSEGNANHKPITNNQEPITILKPEEPKGSLSGSLPTCPHKEVIHLFHSQLPELPEVRIWNKTRESLLKARWRETAIRLDWKSTEDGLEYFRKLFTWIRQSNFLMGKINPKPGQRAFECELEWILRPQNWAKLIEGKYHAV